MCQRTVDFYQETFFERNDIEKNILKGKGTYSFVARLHAPVPWQTNVVNSVANILLVDFTLHISFSLVYCGGERSL